MSNVTETRLEIDDGPEDKKSRNLLSRSMSKVSNVTYNAKKTMAQGMMDIALLTANANQLRYILEFRHKSTNFVILLILIACSLILQVLVGIMLIFKGHLDFKGSGSTDDSSNNTPSRKIPNDQLNNYVVLGVFLITVINIFIAAFTTAPT
ncbi:Ninjurin [Cinara cedri]|uniref:Ninjurin n=1 Tax=Cinara cedri TaxID=506608 RepID=A0A5E4MGM0_9HEMI|nr:Ninjurin [Cinara cedri]